MVHFDLQLYIFLFKIFYYIIFYYSKDVGYINNDNQKFENNDKKKYSEYLRKLEMQKLQRLFVLY